MIEGILRGVESSHIEIIPPKIKSYKCLVPSNP